MDIFVGSLPFKLKERELREIFEKYGVVTTVKIVIDKITRQSKGFGFVEMPDLDEAKSAIQALNGVEVDGRPLIVNASQKNSESTRPPGSTGYTGRPTDRNQTFNRNQGGRSSDTGNRYERRTNSGEGGRNNSTSDNFKKGSFKKDFKKNDRNWSDKNDNY